MQGGLQLPHEGAPPGQEAEGPDGSEPACRGPLGTAQGLTNPASRVPCLSLPIPTTGRRQCWGAVSAAFNVTLEGPSGRAGSLSLVPAPVSRGRLLTRGTVCVGGPWGGLAGRDPVSTQRTRSPQKAATTQRRMAALRGAGGLGVLPERLGLDVLDHDRVDELPPAMVGAEPAGHVPGGKSTREVAPGGCWGSLGGSQITAPRESGGNFAKRLPPGESWSRVGCARPVRWGLGPLPAHLSRCSISSTELPRWRPASVTRARMSLPGNEAAPSLHREPRC